MTIDLHDVLHLYPSPSGMVPALRGLNFSVAAGEICIVRGPNGSGKSTLVEILAGALKPSAGKVTVSGTIRLVRQHGNILHELTVAEYLNLSGQNSQAILAEWDLTGLAQIRMSELSRGTSQLISVAAVLTSRPHILLADEPAASLSTAESDILYQRVTEYCRENKITLVLVTHDFAAEKFADRIVRLSDGRISEQWLPGESERSIIDRHGWMKLSRNAGLQLPGLTRIADNGDDLRLTELTRSDTTAESINRQDPSDVVVVKAHDLVSGFGEIPALRECTLSIRENSLTAITGLAGSGKTTLLKTLSGQMPVISGTLDVTGSMTLFIDHVGEHLSVREAGALEEFVESLGLENFADRAMNKLSGGQRQKSLVALALSSTSDILLIDDPTNSLDEENRELVCDVLLNQANRTIVVSTSDQMLIECCHDVVELSTKPERVNLVMHSFAYEKYE